MATYRNTRTGTVVEKDGPDELMDRSTRWERVDVEQDGEQETGHAPAVEEFDPSAHSVDDVLVHLDGADDDERRRVLDVERDGKARKSILSRAENA